MALTEFAAPSSASANIVANFAALIYSGSGVWRMAATNADPSAASDIAITRCHLPPPSPFGHNSMLVGCLPITIWHDVSPGTTSSYLT